MRRMIIELSDEDGDTGLYGDEVLVTDHHYTESFVLDASGRPFVYEDTRPPFGFDLRGKDQ